MEKEVKTYEDIYKSALEKLKLSQDDIEDYRPASESYNPRLLGTIPGAIIIWLKSGEQIIYIDVNKRVSEEEKFLKILQMHKNAGSNAIAVMVSLYVQEHGPFSNEVGEKVRKLMEEVMERENGDE